MWDLDQSQGQRAKLILCQVSTPCWWKSPQNHGNFIEKIICSHRKKPWNPLDFAPFFRDIWDRLVASRRSFLFRASAPTSGGCNIFCEDGRKMGGIWWFNGGFEEKHIPVIGLVYLKPIRMKKGHWIGLMKTMASCRFSLKQIHWQGWFTNLLMVWMKRYET